MNMWWRDRKDSRIQQHSDMAVEGMELLLLMLLMCLPCSGEECTICCSACVLQTLLCLPGYLHWGQGSVENPWARQVPASEHTVSCIIPLTMRNNKLSETKNGSFSVLVSFLLERLPWPVLQPKVWASARDHADVYDLVSFWKTCWGSCWDSLLLPEAVLRTILMNILMAMVYAVDLGHIDIGDLCCPSNHVDVWNPCCFWVLG